MTDEARKQHFLACLSDPSRYSLIATLVRGPRCVTELAGAVGLSQSCTTRHLQALLREGIVTCQRQGKRIVFDVRVHGPDAHPVLSWAFGSGSASHGSASTTRPRRRIPGDALRAAPIPPAVEITDALIVAHDRPWESDDLGDRSTELAGEVPDLAANELEPGRPERGEQAPPRRAPAIARDSLDDFLL